MIPQLDQFDSPADFRATLNACHRNQRRDERPDFAVDCPECEGEGSFEELPDNSDPQYARAITCERCGGGGWIEVEAVELRAAA